MPELNLLFVGDIVGKGGRKATAHFVPELRRDLSCGLVIANGENVAGGSGLTRKCINSLLEGRVDVVTAGDHVWDQKDFLDEIRLCPEVVRPANVPAAQPGRGAGVFTATDGTRIGVAQLLGRTFVATPADSPFEAADRIVANFQAQGVQVVIIDFHAEATSEKTAMGRYLDGRVSAVLGTHTHVPTADEQILPGGTAFQCDVGMVGGRDSVLGRAIKPVLHRFTTGMPARFTVVETGIRLHATHLRVNPETGRALRVERIVRDYD